MPRYSANMREMISKTIRDNILKAAAELISKEGWQAFTTEKIAERTGVSRGVLYNYYENKEAIAEAIIEDSIERLNEKLEKTANDKKLSASAKLLKMTAICVGDFAGHRTLHRAFRENLPPPGGKKHNFPERMVKRGIYFENVMAEGIRSGEFAPVDGKTAAMLLVGGMHELCFRSAASEEQPAPEELVKIFLKGITKHKKGKTE